MLRTDQPECSGARIRSPLSDSEPSPVPCARCPGEVATVANGLPSILSPSGCLLGNKHFVPYRCPLQSPTQSEGDRSPPETPEMPDDPCACVPLWLPSSTPRSSVALLLLRLKGICQVVAAAASWAHSTPCCTGLQGSWSQTPGVNTTRQA